MEISREAQEKLARVLGGAADTPEAVDDRSEDASTLTRITRIIEDVSGVDAESITASAGLTTDLDLSSLSLIEIAVQIEDGLRVQIEDEDIWSSVTVDDLVRLVDSRVAAVPDPS